MALTVPMSVAAQEPVLVLASALLLVVPTLVTLLPLALSRSRELDADLDGATLTGDPEGLARGPLLLERAGGRGWGPALVRRTGTPHPLLRSHPPRPFVSSDCDSWSPTSGRRSGSTNRQAAEPLSPAASTSGSGMEQIRCACRRGIPNMRSRSSVT